MKQEALTVDTVLKDVNDTKQPGPAAASCEVSTAASTTTVSTSNAAKNKPVTIDGSRRKFAQQILYGTELESHREKKAEKEAPVLQSTPSLASNYEAEQKEEVQDKKKETVETEQANEQKKEAVENKVESRDTVSSPYRAVAFDPSADREKEENPSSWLSFDGADHLAMVIEKRLSTSMGYDRSVHLSPIGGNEMSLQKVHRQASKDCDEVPAEEPVSTQGKDESPFAFDQFFRLVEKSVCGKMSTQSSVQIEVVSSVKDGKDPFDCECVVSDVQRSTTRKGVRRVILQVRQVMKARGKNEESPAFSSSPIRLLERENSVISEMIADQQGDDNEEQEKDGETEQADAPEGKESNDDIREEPEPKPEPAPVKYESAKSLLSSRCRERLDDYRREKGRSEYIEQPLKGVPIYATKLSKKEIIDREKLRAQYL